MLKWIIAAISWFLAYSVTLHAEQRKIYSTASYLGRAGAMVADADDYNALFVNPAGLALLNDKQINMEIQLESTMGFNDFLTAYFGTNTQGRITSEDKLAFFRNTNNRAKFAALTTYTKKNFGLGLFLNTTVDTDYSDDAVPTVDVFSAVDMGGQVSLSYGFLENEKLRIGGTAKSLVRMGRFGNMDYTEVSTNGIIPFGKVATYGLSLGADIGIQYSWIRETNTISVGLSALDLATPFLTYNAARPPSLSSRIVAGVGLKVPNIFKNVTLHTNFDIYKSVTTKEGSIMSYPHWGFELKFPQFLSLRGGLNQLYWTAGVGIKYWLLEVDFATYAEDIWIDQGGRKSSARRYMFQAKVYF